MKKIIKELQNKSVKDLKSEIEKLSEEIAKLTLENKVNPAKDSNIVFKKRKKMAQLLTVLKEKEEVELLSK
jgi:ribosomal protein L29